MEEAARDLQIPEELPFSESLSWSDRCWRQLEPREMLSRYEAGWRFRGILAEPSEEEWTLIRALCRRFGSFLDVR